MNLRGLKKRLSGVSMHVLLMTGIAFQFTKGQDSIARAMLPERIVQAAEERINAKWYPSLVIAFVDGDKSKVASFGKLDNGKAPDGSSVYEIGSITKTFTAALLAQAILSGRVKPDSAVTELLPGFRIPSRNGKLITVANLATQSSGLPYMPDNLAATDRGNPYADYDAARLSVFLAGYQLKRDPDEAYEYSNLGFGLLGFALTQPRSYGSVVQAKIFQPLGMTMSGVGLTDAMRSHLATGHDRHNQGAENWTFDVLAGCGAIDSTAEDMLRYLKANMAAGKTALSPAFDLAQQPRRAVDKTERIGLAWMRRPANPEDIIWHNGATFGYSSFIGFTADGKRGIVILTNISESVDDLGFAALSDSPLRAYKTVPLNSATLASYAGVYKVSDSGLIRIFVKNGQVYAHALGEEPIPLFPQSSDEFFTRIDGFHLIFHRKVDGGIDNLILRQTGNRVALRLNGDEAASALSRFQTVARTKPASQRR
jgi:CubicO group peptidase (beta-lactamase class C family)